MSKIRVGVVGVGHLGSIHARVYSQLAGYCDFVGVYDIDEDNKNKVATLYNVRAFNTLDDIIANCDALSCAVPTSFHYEVGKKILESGKHLLIEKPITNDVNHAMELVQIAKDNGLKLMVGHTERFNPAMEIVKHVDIKPKFIEIHRLAQFNPRGTDVSVIYDLMIHDVDIVLKLLQKEPDAIDAVGVPVITNFIDIANVRLKFHNSCVVNITTSRVSMKKMRKFRIFQPFSYISIDFLEKKSKLIELKNQDLTTTEKKGLYVTDFSLSDFDYKIFTNENEPLKEEIKNFLLSINEDKEPETTGFDGYRALKLCNDIEKVINIGK